jgi:hypothetical protein
MIMEPMRIPLAGMALHEETTHTFLPPHPGDMAHHENNFVSIRKEKEGDSIYANHPLLA